MRPPTEMAGGRIPTTVSVDAVEKYEEIWKDVRTSD
jgi:hypothetical protein